MVMATACAKSSRAWRRSPGIKLAVREESRRAGDPPTLVAKADKVRSDLGWAPKLDDIDTIVRTSLEWEKRLQREPW